MEEILAKHKQMEDEMNFRHPWFNMFYNYVVAVCVFLLCASFWWWGMDIHTNRIAETKLAETLAAMDEENRQMIAAAEAEEKALKASKEETLKRAATAGAKALYPLDNFITKYHYSESDLITYLRSGWNRHILTGKPIEEVFAEPEQYLGYADNNPVLTEYYNLCYKCFSEWEDEVTNPCDPSFQWAELTENGIYLKNQFNADGYQRRYHA